MECMGAGANIAYGTNSFVTVAPATEDHVGSQLWPSACNAMKHTMWIYNLAHQRFRIQNLLQKMKVHHWVITYNFYILTKFCTYLTNQRK